MITINGKTYQHLFTAGRYPQGSITVPQLKAIADAYNTDFHSAPVWRGHINPDDTFAGEFEPRAFAWIQSLLIQGSKLYGEFADISDELKDFISRKLFKFVSVELAYYLVNGKKTLYLHAVALTNRPAVDSMEPLNLPEDFNKSADGSEHKFNKDCQTKIFFNINFIQMNENLLSIASGLGIDTSNIQDDKALTDAIIAKIKEVQGSSSSSEDFSKALEGKVTPLNKRIEELEAQLYTQEVDSEIAAGKFVPAQREFLISYAKSDYAGFKKLVEVTPANGLLSPDPQVKAGAAPDLKDKKFTKPDGTKYTFAEVTKDPNLMNQFTDKELEVLALK